MPWVVEAKYLLNTVVGTVLVEAIHFRKETILCRGILWGCLTTAEPIHNWKNAECAVPGERQMSAGNTFGPPWTPQILVELVS